VWLIALVCPILFIFRLRRKLEPDPKHPTNIRNAYDDAYRLITD